MLNFRDVSGRAGATGTITPPAGRFTGRRPGVRPGRVARGVPVWHRRRQGVFCGKSGGGSVASKLPITPPVAIWGKW
jgi:hypothetical protein